jgi:hypothetical protein
MLDVMAHWYGARNIGNRFINDMTDSSNTTLNPCNNIKIHINSGMSYLSLITTYCMVLGDCIKLIITAFWDVLP